MELAPHFVLYSSAKDLDSDENLSSWRFSIHTPEGDQVLDASDQEPNTVPERAELLATVRALEALDQPSEVTLVLSSRYVYRGMRFGLQEWRQVGWKWEHFGELVPIKNADLWRRVDRALAIHRVRLRWLRYDPLHTDEAQGDEFTNVGVTKNGGLAMHVSTSTSSRRWTFSRGARPTEESSGSAHSGRGLRHKCTSLVRQVLGKSGLMSVA